MTINQLKVKYGFYVHFSQKIVISTALKQSLAFYELQWKALKNPLDHTNPLPIQPGIVLGSYLSDSKKLE